MVGQEEEVEQEMGRMMMMTIVSSNLDGDLTLRKNISCQHTGKV